LKLTQPYVRRWPEAVALLALPKNIPTTMSNLHELVDEMWYLSGDRSVDMNYYSKRTLLAGVYTSTELFMTQDRSPDFQETLEFLNRRLADVGTIGRTTSQAFQLANFGVKNVLGVVQSFGVRLPFSK
ncbi:Ubiquinone biosynthesis protein coq9, mitochondrial, partial [Nowakowskiella sp. JEL0078]